MLLIFIHLLLSSFGKYFPLNESKSFAEFRDSIVGCTDLCFLSFSTETAAYSSNELELHSGLNFQRNISA